VNHHSVAASYLCRRPFNGQSAGDIRPMCVINLIQKPRRYFCIQRELLGYLLVFKIEASVGRAEVTHVGPFVVSISCTPTSRYFSSEVMTSGKCRSIGNPDCDRK